MPFCIAKPESHEVRQIVCDILYILNIYKKKPKKKEKKKKSESLKVGGGQDLQEFKIDTL